MTETSTKTHLLETGEIPTPSRRRGRPPNPYNHAREEARARGDRFYIDGSTCRDGHTAERYVSHGACVPCAKIKTKAKYDADPKAACQKVKDAYARDLEKSREASRRHYWKNPEKARESSRLSNLRGPERWGGFVTNDPVRCSRCEETKPADAFSKSKFRKNGRCDKCKVCAAADWQQFRHGPGYEKRQKKAETTRKRNKREDPRAYWAQLTKGNVVARAKARGEVTDIDNAWLLANANDMCPLLEIPLKYDNTWMAPDSAAIDRIDNNVGYFRHNCWIISTLANRIKTNTTVEQIETVARNFRKFVDQSGRDLV